MSKKKYTPDLKCQICEEYLSGNISLQSLCQKYGISCTSRGATVVHEWLITYREKGINGFKNSIGNSSYTKEFKTLAVEEYLLGNVSLQGICIKYEIPSHETLRKWIMRYNANRELKDYDPKREVYMAEARRKTTIEERKEIVEYCITHNRDYKGTASKYDVSYSQVYSWVKKYNIHGEESLVDKRGHHKTDEEVDELERLRRENLRLKRKLQESEMANQLLKKVREFERR